MSPEFRAISFLLVIIVQINPLHPVQIIAVSCVQSGGKNPNPLLDVACARQPVLHLPCQVVGSSAMLVWHSSRAAPHPGQLLRFSSGGECVNSLAESLLGFDPQRKEVGEEHSWGGEGATFLPLLM